MLVSSQGVADSVGVYDDRAAARDNSLLGGLLQVFLYLVLLSPHHPGEFASLAALDII